MNVLLFDRQGGYLNAVVYSLSKVPGLRIGVLAGGSNHAVKSSRFVRYHTQFPLESETKDDLVVVEKAIRHFRADVLLPVDEEAVLLVSENKETLERLTRLVPVPTPESMQTAVHKHRLHQFLSANHFPNPPSWLLSRGAIIKGNTDNLSFPIIAKPTRGCGGNGIQRLSDQASLNRFLTQVPESEEYILQEIVIGDDVDCSILCHQNRLAAYTIQKPFRHKNHFGYASNIVFTRDQNVLQTTIELIKRLGFNGLAHIDMVREPDTGRLHIIDMNVRYWATLLGSTVAGVNFPHLACRLALGQEFPRPEFKTIPFALMKGFVRNWVDALSGKEHERIPLKYSTVPFRLRDPGHILASLFKS